MELIGVRVFKSEKPHQKKQKRRKKSPVVSITSSPLVYEPSDADPSIPPLPDSSLKIGQFVYSAMKNLSEFGYMFSQDVIDEMTTSEWSKKTFHTAYPFMKRFVAGHTDTKGKDGRNRFRSIPYTFGDVQVLISKEWHENQRQLFIDWYSSLK